MDDRETIRRRLEALEAATVGTGVGARSAFARSIDYKANGWSQFVTGARPLTLEAADCICDRWGVSLDWLFRGNSGGGINGQ